MKIFRVVVYYGQAKYDLSETCCFCYDFINSGEYFVRSITNKTAHYICAKENGWRTKPKKKKDFRRAVEKPVENSTRLVKIIRDGKVINGSR